MRTWGRDECERGHRGTKRLERALALSTSGGRQQLAEAFRSCRRAQAGPLPLSAHSTAPQKMRDHQGPLRSTSEDNTKGDTSARGGVINKMLDSGEGINKKRGRRCG